MKKSLLKSSEGFSFIELIIAIGFLSLLVAVFVPLIANSFFGIESAGKENSYVYNAQGDVDSELLIPNTSVNTDEMNISFPSAQITVKGQLVGVQSGSALHPLTVTIFKPMGSTL